MAERRSMLSAKMAHAEAKRQEHIDGIRRKAREEDAKLKEIAFINELQAQNTRIDMLAQNAENDEKVGSKGLQFFENSTFPSLSGGWHKFELKMKISDICKLTKVTKFS